MFCEHCCCFILAFVLLFYFLLVVLFCNSENDMPDMEDIYDTVYNGDEDEIYEDLCMRRKPPLEAKVPNRTVRALSDSKV